MPGDSSCGCTRSDSLWRWDGGPLAGGECSALSGTACSDRNRVLLSFRASCSIALLIPGVCAAPVSQRLAGRVVDDCGGGGEASSERSIDRPAGDDSMADAEVGAAGLLKLLGCAAVKLCVADTEGDSSDGRTGGGGGGRTGALRRRIGDSALSVVDVFSVFIEEIVGGAASTGVYWRV